MRRVILLCVVILAAAAGHGEPVRPFTLIAWHGPPYMEEEVARYWRLRCTAIPGPANSPAADYMDLAARGDMAVYLTIPRSNRGAPVEWAAALTQRENGAGWILRYGAKPEEVSALAAEIKALGTLAPSKRPIVTLSAAEGIAPWRSALPQLLAAGMPVVCFDVFPCLESGDTDESGYIAFLAFARQQAEAHGAEVWATVQAAPFDGHRRPSESDIRLQAYTALAHGVSGIGYYAYWRDPRWQTFESWGPGMIDAMSGAVEYGYEMTAILNRELEHLIPHMEDATFDAPGYIGTIPDGAAPFREGQPPFARVIAPEALVATFTGADDARYALLVNRRHGALRSAQTQAATVQLVAHESVATVHEIDRQSGFEKPIPLDAGRSFYITVPGGTGALFRIGFTNPATAP